MPSFRDSAFDGQETALWIGNCDSSHRKTVEAVDRERADDVAAAPAAMIIKCQVILSRNARNAFEIATKPLLVVASSADCGCLKTRQIDK